MASAENPPSSDDLAREFSAAIDWWRGAGVDHDFSDDVTDWLPEPTQNEAPSTGTPKPANRAAKRSDQPPEAPAQKIGGEHSDWPGNLEKFAKWWVESDLIDGGGAYPVVPPRGPSGAKLMILVPEPEERDSAHLLSGPQGKLVGGMVRAMGMVDEDIYYASVLRRHTPMPDWSGLQAAGIAELLSHHIGLAGSDRIIAFGRSILPLLGNDMAQRGPILHNFNHDGRTVPVMGVGSLAELLRSAARRKRFWQHWLEWTDG